ncbi:MAG: hypothetical protein MJ211_06370 [Bacteroidales bacterium]|nr:hypothetical protein [Bacteroidales bacterium]
MQKNWFIIIILVVLINCNSAFSQTRYFEILSGISCNFSHNSKYSKLSSLNFKPGINTCLGFGTNYLYDFLRIYGSVSYTSKGEKYKISGKKFESDLDVFELKPSIRLYFPDIPIYVGGGAFLSFAASNNIKIDQINYNYETKNYYRKVNFGPLLQAGSEIGVGSVRLLADLCLEYGIINYSKVSNTKIHSFCILFNIGGSFIIFDKNFKHY